MDNKEMLEVARKFIDECPNDEGGLCNNYGNCLECWKYELEKKLKRE